MQVGTKVAVLALRGNPKKPSPEQREAPHRTGRVEYLSPYGWATVLLDQGRYCESFWMDELLDISFDLSGAREGA